MVAMRVIKSDVNQLKAAVQSARLWLVQSATTTSGTKKAIQNMPRYVNESQSEDFTQVMC